MSWIEMTDGDIKLTRLSTESQWQSFHHALCADMKLYDVASGFARVISYESLQEYVEKGWFMAWHLSRGGALVGYGIYSSYTGTQDLYIYRADGSWDGALVAAGLELMTSELFALLPGCDRIFTYLPVPLPLDSEEMLFDMGFDPWRNNREHGVKRTYAMERATWVAYHGGSEP